MRRHTNALRKLVLPVAGEGSGERTSSLTVCWFTNQCKSDRQSALHSSSEQFNSDSDIPVVVLRHSHRCIYAVYTRNRFLHLFLSIYFTSSVGFGKAKWLSRAFQRRVGSSASFVFCLLRVLFLFFWGNSNAPRVLQAPSVNRYMQSMC